MAGRHAMGHVRPVQAYRVVQLLQQDRWIPVLQPHDVDTMQQLLTRMMMFVIMACLPALAAGYELQLAYSDVESGPLMTAPSNGIPLPDGCAGQVIEHVSDGPVLPPTVRGNPGGKDRVLNGLKFNGRPSTAALFAVNGAERLNTPGYFVVCPGMTALSPPAHPVYLRIWNAANPEEATFYYDSPLYTIGNGVQQVNFTREQLAGYAWEAEPSLEQSAHDTAVPLEFRTLASFPNPFNGETMLGFALPSGAYVSLIVYDVQGRVVRTLLHEQLAAGEHRLPFRAPELTSGTYFAVLRADGQPFATRRITLLK